MDELFVGLAVGAALLYALGGLWKALRPGRPGARSAAGCSGCAGCPLVKKEGGECCAKK